MIDNSYDVLKTFNDYIEEEEAQFIKLDIDHKHPWKNKAICETILPPDTLIVMIIRESKTLIYRVKSNFRQQMEREKDI